MMVNSELEAESGQTKQECFFKTEQEDVTLPSVIWRSVLYCNQKQAVLFPSIKLAHDPLTIGHVVSCLVVYCIASWSSFFFGLLDLCLIMEHRRLWAGYSVNYSTPIQSMLSRSHNYRPLCISEFRSFNLEKREVNSAFLQHNDIAVRGCNKAATTWTTTTACCLVKGVYNKPCHIECFDVI